ncbi:MAG TPA: ribonuclease III, partial [Actinomycetales bacterium]|nr:ribonuclease III [Actinomycetales bacterium]
RRLGVDLDEDLLALALTHRSYAHESGGIPTNERLEFLGDSVLGLAVTEHLFKRHPDVPEGDLAKMRSATVSQRALASVARDLGLGGHIMLGRGEIVTGGAEKDSILSDTLEAIIGAVYLSHGLEVARTTVEHLCAPLLADARRLGASLDWKTSLLELATLHSLPAPLYAVESSGPDHDRTFTATATVGEFVGVGVGSSKKVAEHGAAEEVYDMISSAFATDGV